MQKKFFSVKIDGGTAFVTSSRSRAFEVAEFLAKAKCQTAIVSDGFSEWRVD